MLIEESLTENVIGVPVEVHRSLGPGLLESPYMRCMARELQLRGIQFRHEVEYKGVNLDCGYRMDFVIEEKLVLEVKAVERVIVVHEAQLLTYLKLSGFRIGLLIYFNSAVIRNSIVRRVL